MPRPVTVSYHVSRTAGLLASDASGLFASTTRTAVEARGRARVAISGGNTPKAMFSMLADPERSFLHSIPWQQVDLFWVDERCVPPTHDDSNFRVAKGLLLSKVPIVASQIHRMEGELDPEEAAARYESEIRNTFRLEGAETPVFDLVLLGMGDDGHTASLFPHTAALDELSRLVVANHIPQKDTWRISLTWPVINAGRTVAFLVEGAGKANVVHEVLQGPYQPEDKPSQLIRPTSGKLLFLLDADAAAKLPVPDGQAASGILELR